MRAPTLLPLLAACAAAPAPDLSLPPRDVHSPTGTQLLARLSGLSLRDREAVLWHEVAAGNVPAFLRAPVPITLAATIRDRPHTATFWCLPDYFGVGSDADWFRLPLTPELGQRIADRLDCSLPTRRMVDAIWAEARLKLTPFPYDPAVHDITAVDLFHRHHQHIEAQRQGQPQHRLTAGTKKDVVASALIGSWPGRVVIYGWHQPTGKPIQPLSKVHTSGHVDYSHGLRLVCRRIVVDGVPTTVDAVLADPVLHELLSDEGAFTSWRYPIGADEWFAVPEHPATGPAPRLPSAR